MYGEPASVAQVSLRQTQGKARAGLQAAVPALYIVMIVGAVIATSLYVLRFEGIFACQADGYTSDRYLAECTAAHYGNYEHGAHWFGLEPEAVDAVRHAQVLFLGDSRVQVGFSTRATADWFAGPSAKYYLLGFGSGENMIFADKLLHKLKPTAKVYVINAETFFEQWLTRPMQEVTQDPQARKWYETKRKWQIPHKLICGHVPELCGHNFAVYRSLSTGAYEIKGIFDADGQRFRNKRVTFDESIDREKAKQFVETASEFLSRLPVNRECVILTAVPHVGTKIGTSKALADALGMKLIAPELDGLEIFDSSHLDKVSAQRWSAAFYAAAGPKIQKCLGAQVSTADGAG